MNFAAHLRHELAARALQYSHSQALRHYLSYGETPTVCFAPDESLAHHGNFISQSYKAIVSNPLWRRRLAKVHTQARRNLPPSQHGGWRELDACTSSDALLMNVFCHPDVRRNGAPTLALYPGTPHFGYKARVPLLNGRFDRTEVDMRLGDLLVEAKLTESDFQRTEKPVLTTYRDFHEVFDRQQLPQTPHHYLSYQLLRNVLAAFSLRCSFCVLLDARRPDLKDAWYSVMKCVKPIELRTALRVLTWQELAQELPPKLQTFLATKYGIDPQS